MSTPPPTPPSKAPGDILDAFGLHLAVLRGHYDSFVWLFAEHEPRFELLRKAAPYFLKHYLFMLLDHVVLGVARMTDRHRMGSNENLTIAALHERWERQAGYEVALGATSALGAYNDASSKAVAARTHVETWRHKRLAHQDLDLALSPAYGNIQPVVLGAFLDACEVYVVALESLRGRTFRPRMTIQGAKELLKLVQVATAVRDADQRTPVLPSELLQRSRSLGAQGDGGPTEPASP